MLLIDSAPSARMSAFAVTALGLTQLVNWGVLYYAFAVLLLPVQRELALPAWAVTGAFSLALLVSALLAPLVGRLNDRGYALRSIVAGGFATAALFVAWTLMPGVVALYLVWSGLGVCMAASLYEPAFALVTRAHAAPESRQRALAIVTVYGGLASTVFLPLTDRLVAWVGWRGTVAGLAVLAAAVSALAALALRGLEQWHGGLSQREPPQTLRAAGRASAPALAPAPAETLARPDLRVLAFTFGWATLASASFISNLVPALGERGLSPAVAAWSGGLFGVLQLPGRALMVSQRVHLSPRTLVVASLSTQAVGLAIVAITSAVWLVAIGVMTFAAGAGLTILARPTLVYSRFGVQQSGYVNGRLARAQQLARAAGPFFASTLAAVSSHMTVLLLLAVTLALLAWRFASQPAPDRPIQVLR